jgi:thiamine biosynthesis protein ThiS
VLAIANGRCGLLYAPEGVSRRPSVLRWSVGAENQQARERHPNFNYIGRCSDSMQVIVNGKPTEVPENTTIADLLAQLEMSNKRLALERNLEVVARAQWPTTHLAANDRIEIVQFVGGGA